MGELVAPAEPFVILIVKDSHNITKRFYGRLYGRGGMSVNSYGAGSWVQRYSPDYNLIKDDLEREYPEPRYTIIDREYEK